MVFERRSIIKRINDVLFTIHLLPAIKITNFVCIGIIGFHLHTYSELTSLEYAVSITNENLTILRPLNEINKLRKYIIIYNLLALMMSEILRILFTMFVVVSYLCNLPYNFVISH